jgi:pectin methylesterase-like acyl-CoA thioesterase
MVPKSGLQPESTRRSFLPVASHPATRLVLGLAFAAGLTFAARAQAPEAIPGTATLLAGGANSGGTGPSGMVLPASGSPCFTGSLNKATDAYGDGCPGPYATFSADFRGGVVGDGAGNIYVIETTETLLRKIDAKSGIVTAVTGTAITGCTTNSDGYGDGCPLAQTKLGSARGGGIDPYGNVILAGYNMDTINVICNAVSPLCPNTPGHKQVGYMYRVAGCVASATAAGTAVTGTTAGTGGDGGIASPNGDLSGDITDWGGGSAVYANACASSAGVSTARGATADKYGNVYIADTANLRFRVVVGPATFTLPNGAVLTNPLGNIIALNPTYSSVTPTTAYGHIYPIMGAFSTTNGGVTSPTTAGASCAGSLGGVTLDTIGDGCPFYESTNGASTSSTLGVGVDSDGNAIIMDQNNKVMRVLYVGGTTMANAIRLANNNPSLTITPGYIYPIISLGGVTGSGISYKPTLGTATAINSNGNRMAIDPYGNLFFSDYGKNSVYMFDINTGYVRNVLVTGTPCATAAPNNDSAGDGCSNSLFGATLPAAAPFSFGAGGGSTIGIAFDAQGNLIIGDIANALIRRVTASDLAPVQVGTSLTQQVSIHAPAGTTGITAALVSPSSDITVGTPTCASAANTDNTLDCQVPVTFSPVSPGRRFAQMAVTATGPGTTSTVPLIGTASGSALVADVASPATATGGSTVNPSTVAVDGSDVVFTVDSGHFQSIGKNAVGVTLGGTPPSNVLQLAVDGQDNLYAVSGTASITKDTLSAAGTYSSSAISIKLPAATYATVPANLQATPSIYGIAVDAQGNLYFSDRANQAVFEIPVGSTFESLNNVVPVVTGFTNVGELALDGAGNLLISDAGVNKVYRLQANTALYPTPTLSALTTVVSSGHPTHIAADTAGNVYVQDPSALTITAYPLSGASSSVFATSAAGQGLAVDDRGWIYEAEASATTLKAIQRSRAAFTFPNTSTTLPVTFANDGNLASTGYASTDPVEFPLATGTTNGCGTVPSVANALAVGAACTATASFNPGHNGQLVNSVTSLLAASSTTGMLTLTGQEPLGVTYTTTTTVTGPSAAVYSSGTEITFTVSESASDSTSQNGESVAVTVDNGSATPYTLSGGSVSVPLTGLAAGPHTITANYNGDGTYLASNGSANFSITQAPTSITWNPTVTTLQYSGAINKTILNATATAPGTFIYTATPTGGSALNIHTASYLPVGTYSLGVTFVPTDAVDYAQSTASVPTFTVTQATTTAALGATQMLVAADSTGNFTTVQAAVNTLPNGGSVYIKPGTYPGFITVVQPNVALRGLGGDPTKVILTHEAGAFGSTYPYTGEFQQTGINAGNGGSSGYQNPSGSTIYTGDVGSSTLVVTKGVNTSFSTSTTIPNGFYAENLSLINGYDTDTTTTTTTYEASSNGTCVANEGPAMTYSALFNAGTLCGSQALAVAITGDLAVFNNVFTTSLQDTIYSASQGSGANGYVPSREYWFRGKVTGNVDYIFGDGGAVFDHTSIYTAWHGTTATGTETIHAQEKFVQTGGASDYISGYIMNSNTFTSQSTGMTSLYFGRPYGTYSTWVMLNTAVDQVNALGYTTGLGPALTSTTFSEFNDIPYTDPATNAADLNGIPYLGTGGNTGSGVTGTREASSTNPGTPMSTNGVPTSMTLAQAQAYFPNAFLGQTVPLVISSTQNWVPTDALASAVSAFVPSGTSASIAGGSSVTILMRPQTPGLGAVANTPGTANSWTIPTGTYTLTDSFNSGAAYTVASGNLDASGEAYFTSSALSVGTHNLTWTYSGDANFAGSTTSSAYVLTVIGTGTATTTAFSGTPAAITYGQSATVNVAVTATSGTATGSVTLTIDGATTQTATLSSGAASFTVPGLVAGSHTFSASYAGNATYSPSSTTATTSVAVGKASLIVQGTCTNRLFDQPNVCNASVLSPYQYSDGPATVFSVAPSGTTAATRTSPANTYVTTATYTPSAFGSANYNITLSNSTFTVTGGVPQSIIFPLLPNFASGSSYQLTARTTSGLPVAYTVTTGNAYASVTGSVLTLTGPGAVTIQATTPTDSTGDYATAPPVSRSFTAQ